MGCCNCVCASVYNSSDIMLCSFIYFPVTTGETLSTWQTSICSIINLCVYDAANTKWLTDYVRIWNISASFPLHSWFFPLIGSDDKRPMHKASVTIMNTLMSFLVYASMSFVLNVVPLVFFLHTITFTQSLPTHSYKFLWMFLLETSVISLI